MAFLIVNPLLPSDTLTHFAIDNLLYHGHELTIFWDSDGTHYNKGQGLHVWVDAQEHAHATGLERPDVISAPKMHCNIQACLQLEQRKLSRRLAILMQYNSVQSSHVLVLHI